MDTACLLDRARAGDRTALGELYRRYFQRVAGLARKLLKQKNLAGLSGSDIAQNTMASFCERFEANQFPDLCDSNSLWRLLACMTSRKLSNAKRQERSQTPTVSLSALEDDVEILSTLVATSEPDPQVVVEMLDQRQYLLEHLPERLQKITLLRMDDAFTNEEIAFQLGVSIKRVESMFQTIRKKWLSVFGLEERKQQ